MKFIRFILPAAVVGSAALFFGASNLRAWTLDGNFLSLGDRDFRVFNNFTDPTANNNAVTHTNYPGAIGAPMALWKGAVEWNSQAMGTGAGDPTQVTIGSGNANFDAYYAGMATSSGVIGDNIMSELAGSNGGVLAFTELPGSPGGWRILYYSGWEWHDGPSVISGGGSSFDLQAITCHEYGHALGLGHSNDGSATMFPSAAPLDISLRSIELDDIAGLQSIYGVKLGTKLTAASFVGSGSPLRITGANFPASNVEVWFTSLNPTAPNASLPIRVPFLVSANGGTTVDVNVPANAGKGMLMVRNSASGAGAGLSNAIPFDPTLCPDTLNYCVGKMNSVGSVPVIALLGSNSLAISGGNMTVECNLGVPNKPGIFLHSDNGSASNPFYGGTLCLAPPIVRGSPIAFDTFGYASQSVPFNAFDVGSYRWYQTWYRDVFSPDGIPVGLSDAIQVKYCP
ncbi:MAG TPA: matrixin family metalloprotease [Planctomycetota bacterium]|nr:matrixin family metalloprotease [Planctomycetota bacterium]